MMRRLRRMEIIYRRELDDYGQTEENYNSFASWAEEQKGRCM